MTGAALILTCLSCGQGNRLPPNRPGGRCGACRAELRAGDVPALTPDILAKAIHRDSLPLIVDFWAPWCGPCRMMAPNFAASAREAAPEVRFAKIDTQDHPALSDRFQIRGIPLLIRFADGRETARLTGLRDTADILRFARA